MTPESGHQPPAKHSKAAVWSAALGGLLLVDAAAHVFVYEQSPLTGSALLIPGIALIVLSVRWAIAAKKA